ncbi:hypothetical protein D3C71_1321160 [compost metagenome]
MLNRISILNIQVISDVVFMDRPVLKCGLELAIYLCVQCTFINTLKILVNIEREVIKDQI